MLEKEMSPQKHMIKYHEGNVETFRGRALDDISKQAAAMMRLNSLWGLESKGETKELKRAEITEPDAIQF